MSRRKIIFRGGSRELSLPVTPESYRVERGINVEVVNIHSLGDAVMAGYGTLATIEINCLLPAGSYPFARGGGDPEEYLGQFQKWIAAKTKLRFIVGGAGVNFPVLMQNVSWGEKDGTGDVYAAITLREYRELRAVRKTAAKAAGKNTAREEPSRESSASVTAYTAVYGDTLCGICRKFYGDGSPQVYNRLAAYNGKPNPNILMAGEVLRIPRPLP